VARTSKPVRSRRRLRAVLVGASAGGFEAISRLLRALSPELRPPLIIVLHSAATEHSSLAESLARRCALPVLEAGERQRVMPGRVYVAPAGYHLLIGDNEHFALSVDSRVRFARPSIDVLFESAADAWRGAVAAVLLTGANDDGARGLAAVREHGGIGIVQAPDEAEAPEMPTAALKLAGADYVLRLAEIAPMIHHLSGVTT
jgi:two-component system, chemotaxis family, protein-glutamate methylesterase/glutaminase